MPTEDLPGGEGRRFVPGTTGATDVPGVWVAGNATGLTAQVGAVAAAGARTRQPGESGRGGVARVPG